MDGWLCMRGRGSPREHGRVGVTAVAPLPVLLHGRGDLLPHSDEVLHSAEGQLDVVPLQTHQVVGLECRKRKGLYWGKKVRAQ